MQALESAILRTLIYADLFYFPMTLDELHHFLIHPSSTERDTLEALLRDSVVLQQHLCMADGYIALSEHADIIPQRIQREQITQARWSQIEHYAKWLGRIPFVRMVALTGALAMRNPKSAADDLDYMLVTQRGRVWLARALAIALVRVARLRGVELCPNYIVAEDGLAQTRRDLYIAHEVTQMIPFYGFALYERLRHQNQWTQNYLPNANGYPQTAMEQDAFWLKPWLESLLSGWLGDRLEQWEYRRKWRKFAPQTAQPSADAKIDANNVKGHFQDHGQRVLQHYVARLNDYGLSLSSSEV